MVLMDTGELGREWLNSGDEPLNGYFLLKGIIYSIPLSYLLHTEVPTRCALRRYDNCRVTETRTSTSSKSQNYI